MIQWVYEHTTRCRFVDLTVVATDHADIFRTVERFGGKAVMTSPDHVTGTDRIAEAVADIDARLIVNVQGDEPMLPPETIQQAVEPLLNDRTVLMGTVKTRIKDTAEMSNPDIVKVVTDNNGFALYFSRSVIPRDRDGNNDVDFYRHIGLYVYRRDFLFEMAKMKPSKLEQAEKLEQLRVLENGFRIKVSETDYSPVGVDRPEDIVMVESLMSDIG